MDVSYAEALLYEGGWVLLGVGGAVVLGLLAHALLVRLVRRATRDAAGPIRNALLQNLTGPARLLLPVLLAYAVLPLLPTRAAPVLYGGLYIGLVGGVAWLAVRGLRAAEEAIAAHYSIDTPDNLKARKVVTQVRILRRIAVAVIVVLAAGIMLLRYDPVRELGAGLLASAGIVGIVVGIAAQRTLGDLLAGIQIALTQPIRVDDVVIVEGEFGWIEEITLTYVVVRVWDRRRVVLPITHFVEKPFQNWTRTSAELIGSVFLYVDYTLPVEELRDELRRVVEASEYWDGDVCALHVTDATERTVELRAIASAQSAPQLWELRCEIRETLLGYLRDQHPGALPTVRAEVQDGPVPRAMTSGSASS